MARTHVPVQRILTVVIRTAYPRQEVKHCHKDALAHKAEYYARFTALCQDGVFWAAVWEVRVNRSERVANKDTDQWVQREGSVELVALWLRGRRHEDMVPFKMSRSFFSKKQCLMQ
jgi:hypothetical protein